MHIHWLPKWYSRQGSWHKTWMCLLSEDDRAHTQIVFALIKFLSFKNQRYRNSSLLFPYFKIKETKDYVTSPRAWTCDFLLPFYIISPGFCWEIKTHLDNRYEESQYWCGKLCKHDVATVKGYQWNARNWLRVQRDRVVSVRVRAVKHLSSNSTLFHS